MKPLIVACYQTPPSLLTSAPPVLSKDDPIKNIKALLTIEHALHLYNLIYTNRLFQTNTG